MHQKTGKGRAKKLGHGLFLFSFRLFLQKGAFAIALFDGLCEQGFNLPVHRAELVLCPGGELCIKLRGKAQRDLLFGFIVLIHCLNKSSRC